MWHISKIEESKFKFEDDLAKADEERKQILNKKINHYSTLDFKKFNYDPPNRIIEELE